MREDTEQLVASRYRLSHRLGQGGMGEVWEAEDTLLGRPVAVKVIDLQRTGDRKRDEIRERAMREGRAAAQIDHPHTVRVYDVVDEHDLLYLVMELVRATPLDEQVNRAGPLDPVIVARIGLDLLDALAAAHRAGVVHRDVKPGNVMVLDDGRVKLADFGIASIKQDPELTATGLVLGTPRYLSPEVAMGERAGAPADLWGLGALLYYAVEGQPPFDRGESLPTLHAVVHDEPRPMVRAGVLEPVIAALLTKDPAARPDDEATRRMLEDAIAAPIDLRTPTPTPTIVAAAAVTTVAPAVTPPPTRPAPVIRTATTPDRRRGGLLLALAALIALVGVGLLLVQRNASDDGGTRGVAASTTTSTPAATEPAAPVTTEKPVATTAPAATEKPAVDLHRPDGVPAGWIPYEGDGWRVWHPATWTSRGAGSGQVDLVDPAGQYLRIGSVTPASNGGDPVAAWENQEDGFRSRHPDYERIRIEPTDYRGYDAAIWEYTFEGQHADNLGFVIGDTGYALNFVTGAGSWDDTADLREAFKAGFEPTP